MSAANDLDLAFEAVGEGPPLLILHGYPSSSHDYLAALPRLTQNYRVVLHDHLGFGLSQKPSDYSYSLLEQAEVALALWRYETAA